MANKFTRNITNVTDIEKVPKYTNNENDLLSHQDGKKTYIRRKKDYHCLTDNIKTVDVKGATDLLTVEVDSENNNAVMTAKRDNTKQNKLSVKTDTPETVDISLKKDVLQVDVKQSDENVLYDILHIQNDNVRFINALDDSRNRGYVTYLKWLPDTSNFDSGFIVDYNIFLSQYALNELKDEEQGHFIDLTDRTNSLAYMIKDYIESDYYLKDEDTVMGRVHLELYFHNKVNSINGTVVTSTYHYEKVVRIEKENWLLAFDNNDDVIEWIENSNKNGDKDVVVKITGFEIEPRVM